MRSLKRINKRNRRGLKTGLWVKYYNNGKLFSKGSYINGERDGYWEFYYLNGDLHSTELYSNGIN